MIIFREYWRGKETKRSGTQLFLFNADSEGNVKFQSLNGGNMLALDVTITPVSLRQLRDACNKALEKVTGFEYKTTVTVR